MGVIGSTSCFAPRWETACSPVSTRFPSLPPSLIGWKVSQVSKQVSVCTQTTLLARAPVGYRRESWWRLRKTSVCSCLIIEGASEMLSWWRKCQNTVLMYDDDMEVVTVRGDWSRQMVDWWREDAVGGDECHGVSVYDYDSSKRTVEKQSE